jgi:hypothetical protein
MTPAVKAKVVFSVSQAKELVIQSVNLKKNYLTYTRACIFNWSFLAMLV